MKPDVASVTEKDITSPRCLAVMYHYVRKVDSPTTEGIVPLSPQAFEDQLDALCTVAQPIDWPALRAWTLGEGNLPACSFLLTFDDGLADHAEIAAPILEAHGLRGTFFVAGEVLIRPRMLPAHAIHLLVASLGYDRFARELQEMLHKLDHQRDWTDDLDESDALTTYHYEPPDRARLKYLLNMVLPAGLRNAAVDDLFERFIGSPTEWARHCYLRWDQLRAMQERGHTIGGHGYSHEPLGRMNAGDQRRDIEAVAAVLNEGLGREARPLSLPFGSFNEMTSRFCREAGFAHAFTTERDWIDAAANLTLLPRIDTIHVRQEIERVGQPCSSR
jgi:peptidoglycan/xylan/chitin deacetylase (PgdA/CDA1 family)